MMIRWRNAIKSPPFCRVGGVILCDEKKIEGVKSSVTVPLCRSFSLYSAGVGTNSTSINGGGRSWSQLGSWTRRNLASSSNQDVDALGLIDSDGDGFTNFSSSSSQASAVDVDNEVDNDPEYANLSQFERDRVKEKMKLLSQTGRLWSDPWEITDEDWSTDWTWDDLEDWTEELCSDTSKDRLTLFEGSNGANMPTLKQIASLKLPAEGAVPPFENAKEYTAHRKKAVRKTIEKRVQELAKPRVAHMLTLTDEHQKQDLIDELFESVEDQMREEQGVLQVHRHPPAHFTQKHDGHPRNKQIGKKGPKPKFEVMVEKALIKYLKEVNQQEQHKWNLAKHPKEDQEEQDTPSPDDQSEPIPLFMDVLQGESYKGIATTSTTTFEGVTTNHPACLPVTGAGGGIVEEWELSAKKDTNRIMLRKSIQKIAALVHQAEAEDSAKRVFVTGRLGVGKSAALTAVAAIARESNHIVLFMPFGDTYRKLGKYIEPSLTHPDLYDIPYLSQQFCQQLLEAHQTQLESLNMMLSPEDHEAELSYLTPEAQQTIIENYYDGNTTTKSFNIVDLLKEGSQNMLLAAPCFNAVISYLKQQTITPFTVVMDEYNVYFEQGHYFHEDYDFHVTKPIPYDSINITKPFMLMGDPNNANYAINSIPDANTSMMKRGSIVAGMTYNRSVAKRTNENLLQAITNDANVNMVHVPRYSALEVEHVLANYETIGVGKLRFDQGDTVDNQQEVEYLKMVSGRIGVKLLNATILPDWASKD